MISIPQTAPEAHTLHLMIMIILIIKESAIKDKDFWETRRLILLSLRWDNPVNKDLIEEFSIHCDVPISLTGSVPVSTVPQ